MIASMDGEMRFLEISLPTPDVQASLEWYRTLGFSELPTADIRQWYYAVVTDGDICLGLHSAHFEQCSLCFVRPELATYVRSREANGEEFSLAKLGVDDFHEALLLDPLGNGAAYVEARTFSPLAEVPVPLIGTVGQIKLPCADALASANFWGRCGFISVQSDDANCVELHAPDITIQLANGTRVLTLEYQPAELARTLEALSERGIDTRATPDGAELRSPEGTRILLTAAD
jgi:catechol 2,3-dioxygenase-like lactoylglutathione lyase family enzyme